MTDLTAFFNNILADTDPEIAAAISDEMMRQQDQIEMIASENIVSNAVLEAQGSVLTNKYAEGYSGRRYYGGCEHIDVVETLAIERAKKLFNCSFVNVQPHSGAQANQAVFLALLQPGDTVLGMSLEAGGHLTHGARPNLSGKWFNAVQYGVDKQTGQVNFDDVQALAEEHRPKLIVAGASAYPRELDFAAFRRVADSVGALLMVDMAHISGLVAAGVHQSPLPHAHIVTSTTHKTLRAARGGIILTNDEALGKKINSAVFPGLQGGPLMHIIAAKAIAFNEALQPDFKVYAQQVIDNAKTMSEALLSKDYKLISGGTDTHVVLIDLSNKNVTGKVAEQSLEKAGITVNKNMVPFDKRSPFVTSGVRIGSPAITTRGMKQDEMVKIIDFIDEIITNIENESVIDKVKTEVQSLCSSFPLYSELHN